MNSGIINVYKEAGYTSFDVVARLRGILQTKKIGHTGTLDPEATGVLPVCIGKATKLCGLLTDKDKIYDCTLLLGQTSDTYDASGTILSKQPVTVTEEEVLEVISHYLGDIMQVPPMYSALKVGGKKLYELARAGVTVERAARPVTIYGIDVLSMDLPEVKLSIHCSKGTYIRSLCHDIGSELGCGGLMKTLVRTRVSIFDISDAKTLDEIEKIKKSGQIDGILLPLDQVFDTCPTVYVAGDEDLIKRVVNGSLVPVSNVFSESCAGFEENKVYRLYLPDNRFLGLYTYSDGLFIIKKFFLE